MSSITHDLIEIAYKRFIEELPQLEKLKLVATQTVTSPLDAL